MVGYTHRDERRKFPRYSVLNHPRLRGSVLESTTSEELATIALGGCGFYGTTTSSLLQRVGTEITCVFEMAGVLPKPLEIPATIVYASKTTLDNKDRIYFGLRFAEKERDKVQVLVAHVAREHNPEKDPGR